MKKIILSTIILFYLVTSNAQQFIGGSYVGVGMYATTPINLNSILTQNGFAPLNASFGSLGLGVNCYWGKFGFFGEYAFGFNFSQNRSNIGSVKIGPSVRYALNDKWTVGGDLYYSYNSFSYGTNRNNVTTTTTDSLSSASSGDLYFSTVSQGFGFNMRCIYQERFEFKFGMNAAFTNSEWKAKNIAVSGLPSERMQYIQLGINYHFKYYKKEKK